MLIKKIMIITVTTKVMLMIITMIEMITKIIVAMIKIKTVRNRILRLKLIFKFATKEVHKPRSILFSS